MKLNLFLFHIYLFVCFRVIFAQNIDIKGVIVNETNEPIDKAKVIVIENQSTWFTNYEGVFSVQFDNSQDFFQILLKIEKTEYESVTIPITITDDKVIDLGYWKLKELPVEELSLPEFELSPQLIDDFENNKTSYLGTLRSSKSEFLEATAYQFSSSFFSIRGLDNSDHVITINGIKMNSFENRRPTWSDWGGLNTFTNKVQQFYYGGENATSGFGGVLGLTTFNLKPSELSSGFKISQAFSNSSYQYRIMASYNSKPSENGLQYASIVSLRKGNQGFIEGTPYNSFSAMLLLEKQWNINFSSWFSAWYTPIERGKNAPLTKEVVDIKGIRYNPYWGIDQGKIRNSRTFKNKSPSFIFTNEWKNGKWKVKSSVAYFEETKSNSRLSYTGAFPYEGYVIGGATNPDPIYYQNLPSYFLRNTADLDFENAYLSREVLVQNGQLDWGHFRFTNQISTPEFARYILYQDVRTGQRIVFSSFIESKFHENFSVNANLNVVSEKSNYFASPNDLLGNAPAYDVDIYAQQSNTIQNNELQPNKQIFIGDRFLYNYIMNNREIEANVLMNYKVKNFTFKMSSLYNLTEYQRQGLFQNGSFSNNSFGKGERLTFNSLSFKINSYYAISGKQNVSLNIGRFSNPPSIRNSYPNIRENNLTIDNLKPEQKMLFCGSYKWNSLFFDAEINAYWIEQHNLNNVSFYFADGVGGDNAFFIQEVLTGIQKKNMGLEVGASLILSDEWKIKSAVAYGNHRYLNNPQLSIYTDITQSSSELGFENGSRSFGDSQLQGLRLSNGPQQAYSLSIQYNDVEYWSVSLTANYFNQSYLAPNPLRRTQNFFLDRDGLPFVSIDPTKVNQLLTQEKLPSYFTLNIFGYKSWKIKKNYISFVLSIQNILNQQYITGGFEQGRNSNYQTAVEDFEREIPLFSSRYWYGRGTTFFTSLTYKI